MQQQGYASDQQIGSVNGCPLRNPPAIKEHFANPFHPSKHVVNGLTANSHQLATDDLRYKIARNFENIFDRRMIKSAA